MSSIETQNVSAPIDQAAGDLLRDEAIKASEPRNLFVLAAHYVFLRVGWIFKTETVIMPAFMDTIAGAGWLRGCLPVLNRFGASLPPMLLADRLRNTRRKKWSLLGSTLAMAVPFLFLSAIWFSLEQKRQVWLPAVFLLCYTAFFSATGLNRLCYGTVQGKLIRAHRRGRLLGLSGLIGSIVSVLCAWFLLQYWLGMPDGGYGYIFAFTGLGFILAGLCSGAVVEPADDQSTERQQPTNHFRAAWNVFRHDPNFRRMAVVAMLFITVQLLFPHYQALGRERLNLKAEGFHLMIWVIAQNGAVGIFSLISGAIADRFGNRLAIRLQIFATAMAPPIALLLTSTLVENGQRLFWITFCLLGLTPVTIKTLVNYTLELAEPADHPRYVSTLSVCLAVPFCLSPVVGLLVDLLGFEIVFMSISTGIAAGAMLTFRMAEPRRWHREVTS